MRRRQRTLVGVAGIAATVLLHSLLFAVAVLGGGRLMLNPKLPDAVGSGANTGQRTGESGERRITVMLAPELDIAPPSEPAPLLPEPAIVPPAVVEITGLDALPLPPIDPEFPGEEAEDQDAQMMARAKFSGIYESQVRARIERAWTLPDGPSLDPDFTCLVLIHQHQDGRVGQVELVLDHCNGSPDIQQSLVNAIYTASPLPAPPHPSVFVERFSLEFHGNAAVTNTRVARMSVR